MATLTTFDLTEAEKETLLTEGHLELNHHWTLSYDKYFSCTYDGNYEQFFTSYEDLLSRENELVQLQIAFGEDNISLAEAFENDRNSLYDSNILDHIQIELFKTEAEKEAYVRGLEAMQGWSTYQVFDLDL